MDENITIEDVKPSNKLHSLKVVQGLLEGYFEEGAEFKVMGMSVFADKAIFHGFGLKKKRIALYRNGNRRQFNQRNLGTGKARTNQSKNLTIERTESLLRTKVKIKNND